MTDLQDARRTHDNLPLGALSTRSNFVLFPLFL